MSPGCNTVNSTRRKAALGVVEVACCQLNSAPAIALAAASRAARVATDSAQETRLRTLATWVAQNRIAELTAANAFPGVGNVNGNSAMAGAEFSWQQTTSTTPNAAFRRVELTVLQPGDTRYLVKLNAYLVRPPGKSS